MKTVEFEKLSRVELKLLYKRPAINLSETTNIVKPMLVAIKRDGYNEVIRYAKKYDGLLSNDLMITQVEMEEADTLLSPELKDAIRVAADNIRKFHSIQFPAEYEIETMPGVKCKRSYRPIENVGLYIPGGTAVLPSTMLMLGIPAQIAGCKRVIACSPTNDKLHPAVLYAARLAGINEMYKVGGAQAVGMMAYGVEGIDKVDKIFGPGNQYVTAAKTLVSIDPEGCLIDMPAGPSELLVIADDSANASFIAADLLSQAEHGADSQVMLVTTSKKLVEKVSAELQDQLNKLARKEIVSKCLKNSINVLVNNLDMAIQFSNQYAPEHLIINVENVDYYLDKILNAGSVFVGPYSPESVGDYASGTNHSLPTYGYAKATGGVTVEMFMKSMTFQTLSKKGLKAISNTVITLAETESLDAHANAVKVRFK